MDILSRLKQAALTDGKTARENLEAKRTQKEKWQHGLIVQGRQAGRIIARQRLDKIQNRMIKAVKEGKAFIRISYPYSFWRTVFTPNNYLDYRKGLQQGFHEELEKHLNSVPGLRIYEPIHSIPEYQSRGDLYIEFDAAFT